jgi:hypothetical protein
MPLVSKTFSQIITFTRASTATFFDSAGVLTSAAIDAPRFDFNPSTLAARGLLIEEARTNLLFRSEDFATTWVPVNTTILSNVENAPSATTTADKLILDAGANPGNSTDGITQTQTLVNSTVYTYSIFAKSAGTNTFRIRSNVSGSLYNFVLSGAGTAPATNFEVTAASIQPVGNGWYRCTWTFTTTTTAPGNRTDFWRLKTDVADGTNGVFIWGAQVELGAFPTSYIPTTTTALTRAADVASVNTLSPWFNSASGTIYADFAGRVSGTTPYMMMLSNTGETERIYQRYVGGQYQSFARVAGVDIASVFNAGEGSAVNAKIATAYDSSQLATSTNGQAVTGAAVASLSSVPSGLNKLWLGSFAGLGSFANGYLRRVSFFPRRLSNAELQTLTS